MSIRRTINTAFGLIFLGLIGWYLCSFYLERRSIEAICAETKAGISIVDAKSIVAANGFLSTRDSSSPAPGAKADDGAYLWIIASPMSMGDFACFIRHDGIVTLSSELDGP